jgi:hypothetical protein
MFRLASFHRFLVAATLALWALLGIVFVFTAPQPGAAADGAAGTLALVSAYAFLGAQTALVVGSIGVAHLLRDRTPVLAPIAAVLSVFGAMGHAAFAGIALVQATGNEAADAAVQSAIDGPAGPLGMVSVICTVGGVVVLAIALFRSKLGAAWIGIVLLGWVVVEFGISSSLGVWGTLGSATLLLVGYGALAVIVFRSDLRDWMTVREAESSGALAAERTLTDA